MIEDTSIYDPKTGELVERRLVGASYEVRETTPRELEILRRMESFEERCRRLEQFKANEARRAEAAWKKYQEKQQAAGS